VGEEGRNIRLKTEAEKIKMDRRSVTQNESHLVTKSVQRLTPDVTAMKQCGPE
jgi:hypothetical protein